MRQVLNQSGFSVAASAPDLAARLKTGINLLKAEAFELDSGQVNYSKIKGSQAYDDYVESTRALSSFPLKSLKTADQQLAFWINLYNVLTIHGIIALGIRQSVQEVKGFFEETSYHVGGYLFSLDEIEHGILRGNQKKHFFAGRPFNSQDPRRHLMLSQLDPRLHFALVCGSHSCPPIGVYQAEQIQQQLNLAAHSFINSSQVILQPQHQRILISKIFDWYGRDFGSRQDLIQFLASYRQDPAEQAWLRANKAQIQISFLDYDWRLNQTD